MPATGGGGFTPTGGEPTGPTVPLCAPEGDPTSTGALLCTIAPGGKSTLSARLGGKFVNGAAKFCPTVLPMTAGPGGKVRASGMLLLKPPIPVLVRRGVTVPVGGGKPGIVPGARVEFGLSDGEVSGGRENVGVGCEKVSFGREKVWPGGKVSIPLGLKGPTATPLPVLTVPEPPGPPIVGAPAGRAGVETVCAPIGSANETVAKAIIAFIPKRSVQPSGKQSRGIL